MTSLFVSISLIAIISFRPSCSFPLRHVGGEKKATQHNSENRDLILCWVTQIRRREMVCHCDLEGDLLVADRQVEWKNGTRDTYRLGHTLRQQPDCSCQQQQREQHISAFSREIGLHLVHTFEQFPDHFLLCLVDVNDSRDAAQRNTSFQSEAESQIHNLTQDLSHRSATSRKSKSEIIARIHRLHSDLKSRDKLLFDRHKEVVENRLQQHDEVLWFSSEYVHRHRSRSQATKSNRLETLQHAGMPSDFTTRLAQSVEHTGQAHSIEHKGQAHSIEHTGQAHSVEHTGQANYIEHTGQTHSIEHTGQAHSIEHTGQAHYIEHTGKLQFIRDPGDTASSQSDYSQSLPLLKSSSASSDPHVPSVDGISSMRKSVQPVTSSRVDDFRLMKEYSMEEHHLQNQPTQSGDPVLNRNKSTPFSVASVSRRSVDMRFNDPKFPKQWHLVNKLTTGMDLNVTGVWMHNYTGYGVTIAVVDDGLEWRNPDLEANYNHRGSWDMNDNDPDPSPNTSKLPNHHGTRCAGEIAAVANNSICGVGVAYQAQVSGLRVLDGLMTDSMEAEAFNMKMDINDIYSCSWGPDDDGRTVDGPHLMAAKALQHGVDFGRRGYGSIYVLASGNGGENLDNCNFDGYANSIYTVTIGAVDDEGSMPYYAEECASMLGVTFSSGTTNKRDIVTTDWTVGSSGGCTEGHTGTSAAAPLAAAMIALMLQARPCLSWRDVQYIIILTAQMVDRHYAHSQRNGAGLLHSHKHGFGLLNSWRLVNAARVWQAVPWLTSYSYAESDRNLVIPKGKGVSLTVAHVVSDSDVQGLSLFTLENVQLTLTLSHPCRGKIGITLTSPAGTVSVLAAPRPKDNSTDGFHDWTFTSVRCWGETPTGNWTFNITDHDETIFGTGLVTKWRLTLFGTSLTRQEFADRQKLVESAMSGYFLNVTAPPCPPSPRYDSVTAPISDRILKVLILCGAFCLIMAVYETFEYMLCYNDEKQEAARTRLLVDRAQEMTHTTRVLDSDDHQMSNGTLEANNTHNLTDEDDEEEDIFDSSETSRLLKSNRRVPGHAGVQELTEDIPLETFSVQSAEHRASQYSPLPLATGEDNSELNIRPVAESQAVTLNSIFK